LLTEWLDILAGTAGITGIYVPFDRGYQNNTTEPEMTQSNLGYSEKTQDFPPMIKGFANISYADYKSFFAADNRDFDVWLVEKDGTLEGTATGAVVKGYRGKVFVRYNAPNADNLQESFPIDISFVDVLEWKIKSTTIKAGFTPTELLDSIPAGLDVEVKVAYAIGGNVTLKVTRRNQDVPYPDLITVPKWKILSASSDLDVGIISVDDANAALGEYVLNIQANVGTAPTDLTGSVLLAAIDDDGTNVTYISAPFTVN